MISEATASTPLLSLPSSLNPFEWSTLGYLFVIGVFLLVHQFMPREGEWYLRLGREIVLTVPAVIIYFAVRGVVDGREDDAFRNAGSIVAFQSRLGIFHEPTMQGWILGSEFIVRTMNWIYIWGHWPVVICTLVWLIIWRPQTYSIYRNALLISGLIAIFIFATYPVAPPRLMPDLGVVDTVLEGSRSYRVMQPPALTNPYAAMPSLHFGWNLLMGIAIVREARLKPFRLFGYVMPVVMYIGIIMTANHYLIDGIVGGILVGASLWISIALVRAGGFDIWRGNRNGRRSGSTRPAVGGTGAARQHPLVTTEPLVTIAHRAGNDIELAKRATNAGVDVVEADLWLYQRRLEVRHSKTIGPLPLRWDRWWIRFFPPASLELKDLLREIDAETTLMLDLKGRDTDLPTRLLATCRQERPGKPILVCSQSWPLLEALREEPDVSTVYSIGNARQLRRAMKMLKRAGYDAVSIHNKLLTRETVRKIQERVPAVITWPINDHKELELVRRFGVTGVISDSIELLAEIERHKAGDCVEPELTQPT